MNIIVLGAAGFIGTNLICELSKDNNNNIVAVDRSLDYFAPLKEKKLNNVMYAEADFSSSTNFYDLLENQDVVYHLVSTTIPLTANQNVSEELEANVVMTTKMLEVCVKCGIKRVIFISSGGTVYGKETACPLVEETPTYPINSYGLQKITIEKLLYLYHYMYGLDYRVVRLANPYGPYQRPNGLLGAVTTFTYKAICDEEITVYGDGSVVRDYIYIDDAIRGLITVANNDTKHKVYNIGCGYGTSINELLQTIECTLGKQLRVVRKEGRKVDVPVNYLDINRYESEFGKLSPIMLEEGIRRTAEFLRDEYIK